MSLIMNAVKEVTVANAECMQGKQCAETVLQKMLQKPTSLKQIEINSQCNLDFGSKTCPIIGEGRNIGEALLEGDMQKAVQNSALLAFYTINGGAAPVNTKLQVGISSKGVGMLAANVGVAGGITQLNSNNGSQVVQLQNGQNETQSPQNGGENTSSASQQNNQTEANAQNMTQSNGNNVFDDNDFNVDNGTSSSQKKNNQRNNDGNRNGRTSRRQDDDEDAENSASSYMSYVPATAAMLFGGYYGKDLWAQFYDAVSNYGGVAQTGEYGKKAAAESFQDWFVKVLSRNKKEVFGIGCILGLLWATSLPDRGKMGKTKGQIKGKKKKTTGSVDAQFFSRIRKLLNVAIPTYTGKEARYVFMLMVIIYLRTKMSIWLADANGRVVRSIIQGDFPQFTKRITFLMMFSIPSSAVNSGLEYFKSLLAVSFRSKMTKYFHDQYLQKMFYYKITNLDSRIKNPDQRLTADADKWSNSLATLFLKIGKPTLDIALFSKRLSETLGWAGPGCVILWYFVSGILLKYISPAFGQITAIEQTMEGEYRSNHNDILNHAEEISFYNGSDWEKMKLNEKFRNLIQHSRFHLYKKYLMGIYDGMLVKYGANAVAYTVVGFPIFGPGREEYLKSVNNDPLKITKDYQTHASLLINLSKAVGKIVVSYKDVQALAGYTTLINELDEVLDDLNHGQFRRTQVTKGADGVGKVEKFKLIDMSANGEVIVGDNLEFQDVPIISPNGDVLVEKMTFKITPGMHMMIAGPNGCGKSSLFRIMGQLWPLTGGTLHKPSIKDIFYIPQRPYLPSGSLRDQLIYPHTPEQMRALGHTDEELRILLGEVRLEYLIKREGGWDSEREWNDVLSGGEKQRMAMGRLIYHKPKYAILDECTSAVSMDVEGHLYQYMKDQGITLITVSHRPTLWKYHTYLLRFKGDQDFEFGPMDKALLAAMNAKAK